MTMIPPGCRPVRRAAPAVVPSASHTMASSPSPHRVACHLLVGAACCLAPLVPGPVRAEEQAVAPTPEASAPGAAGDPIDPPFDLSSPAAPVPPTSVLELPESAPESLPRPDAATVEADTLAPRLLGAGGNAPLVETSVPGVEGMLLDDLTLGEVPMPFSSGDWFWSGGWYAGVESLWMDRSRNNIKKVILSDVPVVPPNRGRVNYTTGQNQFDISPGARITIGRVLERDALDRDRALEFIWYGGMAWEDNANWNALPGGVFVSPGDPSVPGFNGGTQVDTTNTTDFNSWEFNYRVRRRLGRDQLIMGPNGEWTRHAERGWLPGLLVGVRVGHENESFTMRMSRPGTPARDFNGFYDISTSNWLLGLNLGSELISQSEFFYWGLRGRAAPSLSFASQSQFADGVDRLGPTPRTTYFNDEGAQNFAGFIGDLTFMAGWHISPNFALQVGYDMLWVAGVATYDRQYNLNNTQANDINAGGQAFFQGVSFGFYGSW